MPNQEKLKKQQQYRQTSEYKEKNRTRMREYYHTEDGFQAEYDRRRDPRIRYSKAKYDAGRRKSGAKEFTLSMHEYLEIVSQKCEYCNMSLSQETGSGLDRIDNDKGYIPGNVNPCCKNCNRIRSKSMSAEEFKRQTKLNGRWNETE